MHIPSILLFYILISVECRFNVTSIKQLLAGNSFQNVEQALLMGECNGYLSPSDFSDIVYLLKKEYSHILNLQTIGYTSWNNPIVSINFINGDNENRNGVLFTGMHHAREPISLMMVLYLLFKLLYEYENGNTQVQELISTRDIFFIPLINVDGYKQNCYIYENTGEPGLIRKNYRDGDEFENCYDMIGVDINRNYGTLFAQDADGSSPYPCNDTYRGNSSFSEPETVAIRSFIEQNEDRIHFALNYHASGNFFITPNILETLRKKTSSLYSEEIKLYDDFKNEAKFPSQCIYGNEMETVMYPSNGAAEEWMLYQHHIVAYTPELGTSDPETDSFYTDQNLQIQILRENIYPALYAMQKSGYFLQIIQATAGYMDCKDVLNFFSEFNTSFLRSEIVDVDSQQSSCFTKENETEYFSLIIARNIGTAALTNMTKLSLEFETAYVDLITINILEFNHYEKYNFTRDYAKCIEISARDAQSFTELKSFNVSQLNMNTELIIKLSFMVKNEYHLTGGLAHFLVKIFLANSSVLDDGFSSYLTFSNPQLIIDSNQYTQADSYLDMKDYMLNYTSSSESDGTVMIIATTSSVGGTLIVVVAAIVIFCLKRRLHEIEAKVNNIEDVKAKHDDLVPDKQDYHSPDKIPEDK